jgi:hypothetical protein
MDIAQSFTYVFEDKRWLTKLGIGAVIGFFAFFLLPIPLLVGYTVAVLRNVRDGHKQPLPEWDNWGELFIDGLMVMIAQFIYTLPLIILMCLAGGAALASGGLAELSEEAAVAGMMATFGIAGCLFLAWYVMLLFVSPAIMIQYGRTGQLGACLRFGEVLGLVRTHVGDILFALIAIIVLSVVFGAATSVLNVIPCLGQIASLILGIFFFPYLVMVTGHLYGQIAAKVDGPGLNKWDEGASFT